MICDLHVHTAFSDGHDAPEDVVRAAIKQGIGILGISDHSHTWFDESYAMKKEAIPLYKDTVNALKEKYKDKIILRLGIEQDFDSLEPTDGYDYVIGSVHYLRYNDEFVPVDEGAENLLRAAEKYEGGDIYKVTEAYFRKVARVVEQTNADIIGHFDLITKYTEKTPFFDQTDPRYVKAALEAVEALLPSRKPFEVNTSAISRGVRTTPYPAPFICEYIRSHGGRLILSSDSHSTGTLAYQFESWKDLLRK